MAAYRLMQRLCRESKKEFERLENEIREFYKVNLPCEVEILNISGECLKKLLWRNFYKVCRISLICETKKSLDIAINLISDTCGPENLCLNRIEIRYKDAMIKTDFVKSFNKLIYSLERSRFDILDLVDFQLSDECTQFLNDCQYPSIDYFDYLNSESDIAFRCGWINELEIDLTNQERINLQTRLSFNVCNLIIKADSSCMVIDNIIGSEKIFTQVKKFITLKLGGFCDEDKLLIRTLRKHISSDIKLVFQMTNENFKCRMLKDFLDSNCSILQTNAHSPSIAKFENVSIYFRVLDEIFKVHCEEFYIKDTLDEDHTINVSEHFIRLAFINDRESEDGFEISCCTHKPCLVDTHEYFKELLEVLETDNSFAILNSQLDLDYLKIPHCDSIFLELNIKTLGMFHVEPKGDDVFKWNRQISRFISLIPSSPKFYEFNLCSFDWKYHKFHIQKFLKTKPFCIYLKLDPDFETTMQMNHREAYRKELVDLIYSCSSLRYVFIKMENHSIEEEIYYDRIISNLSSDCARCQTNIKDFEEELLKIINLDEKYANKKVESNECCLQQAIIFKPDCLELTRDVKSIYFG
ncbi:unnamed protein product [Moneuplotes crassus]|uniref:Uncharacterized protein n=1 Tax=Euplotes crassus TaxID=5936 RepID=A0AAD1U847_EUPCR|nr:unnamed protein product [Moneuplotes crassus]